MVLMAPMFQLRILSGTPIVFLLILNPVFRGFVLSLLQFFVSDFSLRDQTSSRPAGLLTQWLEHQDLHQE